MCRGGAPSVANDSRGVVRGACAIFAKPVHQVLRMATVLAAARRCHRSSTSHFVIFAMIFERAIFVVNATPPVALDAFTTLRFTRFCATNDWTCYAVRALENAAATRGMTESSAGGGRVDVRRRCEARRRAWGGGGEVSAWFRSGRVAWGLTYLPS